MNSKFFSFLVLSIIVLASNIPFSSALEQYSLSHFNSKGAIRDLTEQPIVVWTNVKGEYGSMLWVLEDRLVSAKLFMQPHHLCYPGENIVCLNGTITSIKNSHYVEEDDIITMIYEMPHKQIISFLTGNLATNTFTIDIERFRVNNPQQIIQQQLEREADDAIRLAAWEKLLAYIDFTDGAIIQNLLHDSNSEFDALEAFTVIDERNEEWITADHDETTPFMGTILGNKASDLLRQIMKDDQSTAEFAIEEIILTNAYGANVAMTGKTTDYKQWDENWWIQSKQNGINYEKNYDESAGVNSLDLAFRILDEKGEFLGVMKFVINTNIT